MKLIHRFEFDYKNQQGAFAMGYSVGITGGNIGDLIDLFNSQPEKDALTLGHKTGQDDSKRESFSFLDSCKSAPDTQSGKWIYEIWDNDQ